MNDKLRYGADSPDQRPPDGQSLGDQRHLRYAEAFKRLGRAVQAEYYLEAIVLLDSLIGDRLASRLGYLAGSPIDVGHGIGDLCRRVLKKETSNEFRRCVEAIRQWSGQRNAAVHATAKILRRKDSTETFDDVVRAHKDTTRQGISHLRAFDKLDTNDRKAKGVRPPATWPNAFEHEDLSDDPDA